MDNDMRFDQSAGNIMFKSVPFLLFFFFFMLLFSIPAYAVDVSTHSFANCRFPDTGQTICYNATGGVIACPAPDAALAQDGTYVPGAAKPSYTVYNPVGTSSVTVDNRTGLMWVYNPKDAGLYSESTWLNSITACEGLSYADYADWRLPNVREMMSIIDYGSSAWISTAAFINVQNDFYWTSTTYVRVTTNAFYVNIYNASIFQDDKTVAHWKSCVRGGL